MPLKWLQSSRIVNGLRSVEKPRHHPIIELFVPPDNLSFSLSVAVFGLAITEVVRYYADYLPLVSSFSLSTK